MSRVELEFQKWYEGLRRNPNGFPAKGTLAGALVVLERLKETCDLDISAHTAEGGSQIRGASGKAAEKILSRFGETRPLLVEGGRTNRGLRGDIESLLLALKSGGVHKLNTRSRTVLLEQLQRSLVLQVTEIHGRERIKVVYDPGASSFSFFQHVLQLARADGKHGQVSEYLVGAKLQARFPDLRIENKRSSAADQQRNRPGDFKVGDTVFHVTTAPGPLLWSKCEANLKQGLKVYLIVPEESTVGAKQNALQIDANRITVVSLENFLAQNMDELSEFVRSAQKKQLANLLNVYNRRVDEVELDKSLLISIPENLID